MNLLKLIAEAREDGYLLVGGNEFGICESARLPLETTPETLSRATKDMEEDVGGYVAAFRIDHDGITELNPQKLEPADVVKTPTVSEELDRMLEDEGIDDVKEYLDKLIP